MKSHSDIVVKKFGGTSVGSLERIEAVAERILLDQNSGQRPVVVASAMAGETNRLVRLAHDLNPGYRGLAYDMLLASGEQVSIALLAMALEKRGVQAMPLLAHQLGIRTDSIFSKAKIQSVDSDKLRQFTEKGVIPVVAGFQGVSHEDRITTLGRGGSDTTAVALAAALESDVCEIYTDVPAVFSADPRLVPKAREIAELSFEEMMEMASLGSKVLHFRCVELAAKFGVRIHVRSTFEKREGTWVVPEGKSMENPVVSSVTHDTHTAVFKVYPVPLGPDVLSRFFAHLGEKGIVVDIITQSQSDKGQRLAFSVPDDDVNATQEVVTEVFGQDQCQITVMDRMSKISAIGVGMKNHHGVAARFFGVLAKLSVDPQLVTTSDIKISAVIPRDRLEAVAQALHQEFDLDQ